jgi:outer membrane protein assembly factor BamB
MSTLPQLNFNYAAPGPAASPWPTFRRDHRNTGRSPLPARYHGDAPWFFQTGKGLFSTPIVGGDGVIYFGSADHNFYALTAAGREKWRCLTGEIIDSAGALLANGRVVFPSGDGYLRCLRADDGALVWQFDARVADRDSFNNWFEGNVGVGADGALYAGNTNFNYYCLNPDGTLRWTYPTGANAWSLAAFADDGTIFWGSNDTLVHAVTPDGARKWTRRTLGFIAASAALAADTVFIGSFDSYLYALDPAGGKVKWKFKTGDHIYASAAVSDDAVFVGSTDGLLVALSHAGKLLWKYDAGAPIRSSPALGRAPSGEAEIVYFGCGNGRLFALNAAEGSYRWSFDTTPGDPELRDRNDLNGSPALGHTGVYIGGEHGQLWYVPYDYPLHAPHDPRCARAELPHNLAGLRYVSPGGNVTFAPPASLPASTLITLKLVVRENGQTVPARLYNAPFFKPGRALTVRAEPPFPFTAEVSADGHYLHLFPQDFLEPGQTYTLRIEADTYIGGFSFGNLTLGGRKSGHVRDAFNFRIEDSPPSSLFAPPSTDSVPAFEWTRLAVPLPTMLPSLNQIGFDYMDWIIGLVSRTEPDARGRGKLAAWGIGARRDAGGALVADPASDFRLPLSGEYQGDDFRLANQHFTMAVTGIPITFKRFELRGRMGADWRVIGATAFAETDILSIPTFGPLMVLAGLGNNVFEKLLALCTYLTRPYAGPANRRPEGVWPESLAYERSARTLTATLACAPGVTYPMAEHRPGLLLRDPATGEVITFDYHANLRAAADEAGNLRTITLTVPPNVELPARVEAIVLLDVFPLARRTL